MQRIINEEIDKDRRKTKTAFNHDYSIQRLTTEKLLEDMSLEKAVTILKIPNQRSNVNLQLEKLALNSSFVEQLHGRIRVRDSDPEYDTKVEKRHVFDVLVHEAYQYMAANANFKPDGSLTFELPGEGEEGPSSHTVASDTRKGSRETDDDNSSSTATSSSPREEDGARGSFHHPCLKSWEGISRAVNSRYMNRIMAKYMGEARASRQQFISSRFSSSAKLSSERFAYEDDIVRNALLGASATKKYHD